MNIIAAAIIATTVPSTTNLAEQVAILWKAHTNRIARVAAHRAANAKSGKAAIQQVKDNAAKRKCSAMGRNSGGIKK